MALANGTILVYTGAVDDRSDDELSIVIGHEIGHLIRQHHNETISVRIAAWALELVAAVSLGATLPLTLASYACVATLASVFMWRQRFHRKLELEADCDGLLLAARACVDPEEGPRFWRSMPGNALWWLFSHPSNRVRESRLRELLPEAKDVRAAAGCDGDCEPGCVCGCSDT